MNSPNVFVVATTFLACPNTGLALGPFVATNAMDTTVLVVDASSARRRVEESIDIDDFVAELEADEAIKDELTQARKWLASDEHLTIRTLRLNAGLSQSQLAAAIGLHQSNVSAIESGVRKPMIDTVKKLSKALNVSTDKFITAWENSEGIHNG